MMTLRLLLVLAAALWAPAAFACESCEMPQGQGGCTSDGYAQALAQRESGGRADIQNSYGYTGLYQFGEDALRTTGMYCNDTNHEGARGGRYDWSGNFCGATAQRYCVNDINDFRRCPAAQRAALEEYNRMNWRTIQRMGLDQHVGRTMPDGTVITESGLLAGAHLGGPGNLRRYLEGGSFSDANGTSLGSYVRRFGGFQTGFGSGGTQGAENGEGACSPTAQDPSGTNGVNELGGIRPTIDLRDTMNWDTCFAWDNPTPQPVSMCVCNVKPPRMAPIVKVDFEYTEPPVLVEMVGTSGASGLGDVPNGEAGASGRTAAGLSAAVTNDASAVRYFDTHIWGVSPKARFDSSVRDEMDVKRSLACDLADVWDRWEEIYPAPPYAEIKLRAMPKPAIIASLMVWRQKWFGGIGGGLMGAMANAATGNLGGVGTLGSGGLGSLGNLGNLTNVGNMANMGNLGTLSNLANIGQMGNLGLGQVMQAVGPAVMGQALQGMGLGNMTPLAMNGLSSLANGNFNFGDLSRMGSLMPNGMNLNQAFGSLGTQGVGQLLSANGMNLPTSTLNSLGNLASNGVNLNGLGNLNPQALVGNIGLNSVLTGLPQANTMQILTNGGFNPSAADFSRLTSLASTGFPLGSLSQFNPQQLQGITNLVNSGANLNNISLGDMNLMSRLPNLDANQALQVAGTVAQVSGVMNGRGGGQLLNTLSLLNRNDLNNLGNVLGSGVSLGGLNQVLGSTADLSTLSRIPGTAYDGLSQINRIVNGGISGNGTVSGVNLGGSVNGGYVTGGFGGPLGQSSISYDVLSGRSSADLSLLNTTLPQLANANINLGSLVGAGANQLADAARASGLPVDTLNQAVGVATDVARATTDLNLTTASNVFNRVQTAGINPNSLPNLSTGEMQNLSLNTNIPVGDLMRAADVARGLGGQNLTTVSGVTNALSRIGVSPYSLASMGTDQLGQVARQAGLDVGQLNQFTGALNTANFGGLSLGSMQTFGVNGGFGQLSNLGLNLGGTNVSLDGLMRLSSTDLGSLSNLSRLNPGQLSTLGNMLNLRNVGVNMGDLSQLSGMNPTQLQGLTNGLGQLAQLGMTANQAAALVNNPSLQNILQVAPGALGALGALAQQGISPAALGQLAGMDANQLGQLAGMAGAVNQATRGGMFGSGNSDLAALFLSENQRDTWRGIQTGSTGAGGGSFGDGCGSGGCVGVWGPLEPKVGWVPNSGDPFQGASLAGWRGYKLAQPNITPMKQHRPDARTPFNLDYPHKTKCEKSGNQISRLLIGDNVRDWGSRTQDNRQNMQAGGDVVNEGGLLRSRGLLSDTRVEDGKWVKTYWKSTACSINVCTCREGPLYWKILSRNWKY